MNELQKAFAQFQKDNPKATRQQQLDFIRQWQSSSANNGVDLTPKPGEGDGDMSLANIINSVYQGMTLGWGDELMGKLKGADAEAEVRRRDAAFSNAHPVADFAAKVVPSVAVGLASGGAPEEFNVLRAAQRGALTGMATGAVAGAGNGTDLQSRFEGGVTGAGFGGAIGAAAPGVMASIPWLRNAGAAKLAVFAKQLGITPEDLAASVDRLAANGRGDDMIFADAHPGLARLLGNFVAPRDPAIATKLDVLQRARQAGQNAALQGDMVEALGAEPGQAARALQAQSAKNDWAQDAYGKLEPQFQQPVPDGVMENTLGPAFQRPAMQRAISSARLAGDLTTDDPISGMIDQLSGNAPAAPSVGSGPLAKFGVPDGMDPATAIKKGLLTVDQKGIAAPGPNSAAALAAPAVGDAAGETTPRPMTWGDMHQLQQELDDRSTSAFATGKGKLGRTYADIRKNVVDALNGNVDGYQSTTNQYAQLSNLQRAIEQGGNAWNQVDQSALKQMIGKMSPESLQEFRMSIASSALNQLKSMGTNQNATAPFLQAGTNKSNLLKLAFGDDATYRKFMGRVNAEAQFLPVQGANKGSPTFERAAMSKSPSSLAASAAVGLAAKTLLHGSLPFSGMAMLGTRLLSQQAAQAADARMVAKLGPLLMARGAPAARDVVSQIAGMQGAGSLSQLAAPLAAGLTPTATIKAASDKLYNMLQNQLQPQPDLQPQP